MPFDLTPDAYLKLNENDLKLRKEALESYKLQQEIQDAQKGKLINRLGSNLGVATVVVGIIASLVGLIVSILNLTEEQKKNTAAIELQARQFKLQAQTQTEEQKKNTAAIELQSEQIALQTQKQSEETQQEEQKEFNDLLRGATDAKASPVQRVPLIWALQKYWKPEHELVLANALASIIANDNDRAVMESCAEVIGHAYEKDTPEPVQNRLKELLYGNPAGVIGVVMRFENLIWDRHNPGITNPDASQPGNGTDWIHDPRFDLRIFYIGEAVRKNWENLKGANFQKAQLPRILLYEAHVEDANLEEAILSGGRLFKTHFDRAKMSKVHLEGAYLAGAFFNDAHLEGAFLGPPSPADIPKEPEHLDHTDLENTNFTGAHLKGADLRNADLKGAVLDGADVTGAILEGALVNLGALEKSKGKYTGNPKIQMPQ
jgi:hypothetical protein